MKKHQHLVQVYYTLTAPTLDLHNDPNEVVRLRQSHIETQPQPYHFCDITLDPDSQLSHAECQAFHTLHRRFDMVFNKQIG